MSVLFQALVHVLAWSRCLVVSVCSMSTDRHKAGICTWGVLPACCAGLVHVCSILSVQASDVLPVCTTLLRITNPLLQPAVLCSHLFFVCVQLPN